MQRIADTLLTCCAFVAWYFVRGENYGEGRRLRSCSPCTGPRYEHMTFTVARKPIIHATAKESLRASALNNGECISMSKELEGILAVVDIFVLALLKKLMFVTDLFHA